MNNFIKVGIAVILIGIGYVIGKAGSKRYEIIPGYVTVFLDKKTGQTWRYYRNKNTANEVTGEGWTPVHFPNPSKHNSKTNEWGDEALEPVKTGFDPNKPFEVVVPAKAKLPNGYELVPDSVGQK
jgi:hypothetical protein